MATSGSIGCINSVLPIDKNDLPAAQSAFRFVTMRPNNEKILITGLPGTGKTTLIRKIAGHLAHLGPAGFFTAEIREGGIRKGFDLVDLKGGHRRLAHVDIAGPFRVGKYGVDVEGFEKYLDEADFIACDTPLLIIDEIGKMECLSKKFIALINSILNSDKYFIGTIAIKGGGPIEEIKRRPDVRIIEISARNRDSISAEILQCFPVD